MCEGLLNGLVCRRKLIWCVCLVLMKLFLVSFDCRLKVLWLCVFCWSVVVWSEIWKLFFICLWVVK